MSICKGYKIQSCRGRILADGLCGNCRAAKFEDDVAELFRLMGATVRQNIMICGRQIDLYVEVGQGIMYFSAIVECKYHLAHNVTADEVSQVVASAAPHMRDGRIQRAYLVTTVGFAAAARVCAEANSITCCTFDDILSRLINFTPYLQERIRCFEADPISSQYVKLACDKLSVVRSQQDPWIPVVRPIESYIEYWSRHGTSSHLSVIGDFGSGKTSLCKFLVHRLSVRHLLNPHKYPRIPLLLGLSRFSRLEKSSTRSFITDFLVNECNLHVGYDTFARLLVAGKLILFLDGFDEMAMQVDESVRVRNFELLAELAVPNSKILVTGRSAYFPTLEHIRKVFGHEASQGDVYDGMSKSIDPARLPTYEVLRLRPLSGQQIDAFIRKQSGRLRQLGIADWSLLRERIRTTYNLEDLARRPVLLDIIIQTLPRVAHEVSQLNAFRLYEVYTGFWLKRDWQKGEMRHLVTVSDREIFMHALARSLNGTGATSLHHSLLTERVQSWFNIETQSKLDYFEHDVRTCTFLTRDDEGHYGFVHKSFMEYFLATYILAALKEGQGGRALESWLPGEVVAFIGMGMDAEHEEVLRAVVKPGISSMSVYNVMRILAERNGGIISKLDLRGASLNSVSLGRTVLTDCVLGGSDMRGATFQYVQFVRCNWDGADVAGAKMVRCTYESCSFRAASLRRARVKMATFRGCSFRNATLRGKAMDWSVFEECDFRRASLQNGRFNQCKFSGCLFVRTNVNNVKFVGCGFARSKFIHAYLRRSKFTRPETPNGLFYNRLTMEDVPLEKMLQSWRFDGCLMESCDLRQCTMIDQNLSGLVVRGVKFCEAKLLKCVLPSSG